MFDTSIPQKTHLAGVVENVGWFDVIMNDPATTDLNLFGSKQSRCEPTHRCWLPHRFRSNPYQQAISRDSFHSWRRGDWSVRYRGVLYYFWKQFFVGFLFEPQCSMFNPISPHIIACRHQVAS